MQISSRRTGSHPAALYAVVVALTAAVLYLPLLGLVGFASHEGSNPYIRVLEHLSEIRDGHWIPQTYPDLFLGAGYAFPRFYAPLANTVAAGLTAVTDDVVAGVHLSYFAAIVLSALAMYTFLAAVLKDHLIAVVGALAYVSFPYRFQEVFVRGALAESWTFPWYSLILLGGWRLQERLRAPWYLPVAIAGLILSHPQMAAYFLVVSAILLVSWSGAPRQTTLPAAAGVGLLAFGLSAWYWLPQQYYLPDIWASVPRTLWAEPANVHHERVFLLQALTGRPERNGMSLSVGIVSLLANALAAYGLFRPVQASAGDLQRRARWLLVPWWLLLGFMLVPGPVLAVLPKAFGYIQFPWRVLGIMGFLAAASMACSLASRRSPLLTWAALGILVVALLGAGLEPYLRPEYTSAGLERRLASGRIPHGLTSSSEYLPRSVPGFAGPYIRARSALSREIRSAPRATEDVVVRSFVRRGSASRLVVDARRSGSVVLPIIYYDFYRAQSEVGRLATRDSLGLLTLAVPEGQHEVRIDERLTPVYWVALAITAASCLAGMMIAWRRRRPDAQAIAA